MNEEAENPGCLSDTETPEQEDIEDHLDEEGSPCMK